MSSDYFIIWHDAYISVLREICNRISMTQSLPQKGNLKLCQNYRTINLISHSSNVMLNVLLNRLKPSAKEVIAEKHLGLELEAAPQIVNLRILCEKYLQHQQNLYHVFIDFRKAFDNSSMACSLMGHHAEVQ